MLRTRLFVALFLIAGLCAPLPAVHVHEARDHDGHPAPLVHSHFGVHPHHDSHGSTLSEHDADARYLDTGRAVVPARHMPVLIVVVATDITLVLPPVSTTAGVEYAGPSIHGPPRPTTTLRGPPSCPLHLI